MRILTTALVLMVALPVWAQNDPKTAKQQDSTEKAIVVQPIAEKGDSKTEGSTAPTWLYLLLPIIGK